MHPRIKAIKKLKQSGYSLARRGRNHDIYKDHNGNMIPLKRHDFNENDLSYIEKEIGASKGDKK